MQNKMFDRTVVATNNELYYDIIFFSVMDIQGNNLFSDVIFGILIRLVAYIENTIAYCHLNGICA
jgi:hypothetical protein